MEITYIDHETMRKLCHSLAVEFFDKYNEPIPSFDTHDEKKLDAALNNPQQQFNGADLYPTLVDKAAILYYGLVKGHAFENGNKRIGMVTLLVFLSQNGKWLHLNSEELVKKAVAVAESDSKKQKMVVDEIKEWIRKNMIDWDQALQEIEGNVN